LFHERCKHSTNFNKNPARQTIPLCRRRFFASKNRSLIGCGKTVQALEEKSLTKVLLKDYHGDNSQNKILYENI
jgi:hypothetical protein